MSKEIVLKPQGIITEPNKVGQFPAGAFSSASNCAIRSFGLPEQVGVLVANRALLPFNVVGGCYVVTDGPFTVILAECGALGFWYALSIYVTSYNSVATQVQPVDGFIATRLTNDERTAVLLQRNRLILCTTLRSYVLDYQITSLPQIIPTGWRTCGISQGGILSRSFSTTPSDDGGVLLPETHMSACIQFRQKHYDGYELISPPSVPYDFANLSATNAQIPSVWSTYGAILYYGPAASIYRFETKVDIYRTRAQSVGFDSINIKYLPIATGSSFYLSKSDDKTTDSVTVTDGTMANALGEALLTNVAVSGAAALPLPPPPAKTATVFRGYAFYGNRWDSAQVTLLNPYFWGTIFMDTSSIAVRRYGIGSRYFPTGTAVNGSPTLTALASTDGIVEGQQISLYRDDTNAFLINSVVLSKTGTTLTMTSNSTYSGAIFAFADDVVVMNGISVSAANSPQSFAQRINFAFGNTVDATAVGLEPQSSKSNPNAYPNFVPTGGITIRMRTNSSIQLRATNGDNYSPRLNEWDNGPSFYTEFKGQQKENSFCWSEENQPENCPPANFAYAGSGQLHKLIATRDCLWIFCSDGLFRLSGNGGSVGDGYDWVIDPVDPSLTIVNPSCAVVHREYVFAYTNRGLVSISSEGIVRELSDGRINPVNQNGRFLDNRPWRTSQPNGVNTVGSTAAWMVADSANDEIWLRGYFGVELIWVYNVKTDTFCVRQPTLYGTSMPTLGVYNSGLQEVLLVFAGRNSVATTYQAGSPSYEEMRIAFQPIYGSGPTGSHTQKHWQDFQISFRTPQTQSNVPVTVLSGNNNPLTLGPRNIPASSTIGTSFSVTPSREVARVGFTIPRNFPAVSNALSFGVVVGASSNSAQAIEAISVNYIDFSDQRVVR